MDKPHEQQAWRTDRFQESPIVVAFSKGNEKYVFMFTKATASKTLRSVGRFATNPELPFSWHDAAVVSQEIRKKLKQGAKPQ